MTGAGSARCLILTSALHLAPSTLHSPTHPRYMYADQLFTGECGQVDCGLGKNTSKGRITLVEPNMVVSAENEMGEARRVVDGVEIIFYLVGLGRGGA